MPDLRTLSFPPFQLDLRTERLWRDRDEITLKPRAFAMLRFLATHPQQLISKADLVAQVWDETNVSPDTLRSTLRELRRALDDDAQRPRYVETVHGRGYRFMPDVQSLDAPHGIEPASSTRPAPVGRDDVLAELRSWFARAASGQRQIGFVHGEPGIGKTTVARALLAELEERDEAVCVHGQCVSGYGGSEPYMPVLEAMGRAFRQTEDARWVGMLETYAPTWLVELPGLLEPEAYRRLQVGSGGANRDRKLRELAEVVEAISAERPVVVLLEDLHWSDAATLDAIDVLARRTETARLLILGTHRPTPTRDANGQTSALASLRAELSLHDLSRDLPLEFLSEPDVLAYLERRFPGLDDLPRLAEFLHGRTSGNPLMMASHADELVRNGSVVASGSSWHSVGDVTAVEIPPGVRQMIEHQIELLSPEEQRTLESASVAGPTFSAAMVANLDSSDDHAEDHLARVARERGMIHAREDERYEFLHTLHQEILYDRIPPSRRRALHEQIGLHLERLHPDDAAPVAAQLAMHFERGGDVERAVRYLDRTAEVAIERTSHEEAMTLVHRALDLLKPEPDTRERRQAEFSLLAKLGSCLTLTKGYVAAEVRDTYDRAAALSSEVDEHTPDLMSVLAGLCGFYELRGEHEAAGKISRQELEVADRTGEPYDRVVAGVSHGITCFSVGRYDEAAQHLTHSTDLYDAAEHGPAAKPHPTDPGVLALGHSSLVFGALGELDRAGQCRNEAIALADELRHPPSQVTAYYYAMTFDQLMRDVDRAAASAETCVALGLQHGYPYYIPAAMVVSGWAQAHRGQAAAGAEQAAQGVTILEDAGAVLGRSLSLSMLAEAHLHAGDVDAGLEATSSGLALVKATGETPPEAALHWVRGDLLRRSGNGTPEGDVEATLERGIEVARRNGARTQVLGPAMSLAELWAERGQAEQARQLLEASVANLRPTYDVPVLSSAKELLARL